MNALFYASVALWVFVFGKVRQYFLEANAARRIYQKRYEDFNL